MNAYEEEWDEFEGWGFPADDFFDAEFSDELNLPPEQYYDSYQARGYIFHPGLLFTATILACCVLGFLLLALTSSLYPEIEVARVVEKIEGPALDQPVQEISPHVIESADSETALTECGVSARFPQKVQRWCGLITQYGKKHNLPPDLLAALILQESGGNPDAYSRSGAVGLMQVMPRDGLAASFMCVNGPCFADRPSTQELKDPEFNIAYGARMLAGLVKKTGSYREALKSYGPMNVGYYYADIVLNLFQRYGVN